jgi:hypothetical protein
VRACLCVMGDRTRGRVRVALLIQHAICMHHIVTSFVVPVTPPCFSTLSHNRHDFGETCIEHKICVFIFYNFC